MGKAKVGDEFVTHEFDESIAIQTCIVDAEKKLATSHPLGSAKSAIKASLADDQAFLAQLKAIARRLAAARAGFADGQAAAPIVASTLAG